MIREATIEDILYVTRNIRDKDRHEIENTRFEFDPVNLSIEAMSWTGGRWCVSKNHLPIAVGGIAYVHPTLARGWAWGTNDFGKSAIEIVRACRQSINKLFQETDIRRLEALSWEHHDSHKFLKAIGLNQVQEMENYGKNGDDYKLYYKVAA